MELITGCKICDRIQSIKAGTNPNFVAELSTGYVTIGDHQFYKGYTVFISKIHASELHELLPDFKQTFLAEMSLVAEAVFKAFKPDRLNYELLGNTDHHLHWHLFPRRTTDPKPKLPVWVIDKSVTYADSTIPSDTELTHLKAQLLHELE